MTRLEDPPRATKPVGSASADAPSLSTPHSAPGTPASRFARYFVTTGWLHLTLLTGALLFTFPFLWMIATSLRTDEELTDPSLLPEIPTFRQSSPYVRPAPTILRPIDVPADTWTATLPTLLDIAAAKALTVAKSPAQQSALSTQHSGASIDPKDHATSAAATIVNTLAPRIPRTVWEQGGDAARARFTDLLTPDIIADALDDRLARLELRGLQIRTWDEHIYTLAPGPDLAKSFTVESGHATLVPHGPSTWLHYDFTEPTPIVLRYDFTLPCDPKDLHKLLISNRLDNSWHRQEATLTLPTAHYKSAKPNYLGQNRAGSWIYQPPGPDEASYKKRTWVTLVEDKDEGRRSKDEKGPAAASADSSFILHPSSLPHKASLRLILHPSTTPRAIWGKLQWNYRRAFDAVPVATYLLNSLILVGLTTLGTLFSSTFVAYAFARLHWPARSLAFLLLLSTMMLPSQVTMIPSFMIWRELGWYNTLNPLWVPAFTGVAFFIFLMTQHMKTIPRDLEEAARIDGLNAVQTWYYIILPLVKPAAAAVAIMTIMGSWNEFMGPLVYLRDQAKYPLSLGIFGIRADFGPSGGGIDWTLLMASNVLMTLPMILLFLVFQPYFVKGMTMSGMKG